MATSCGYEFQVSHLKFESAEESNFYEFQWTKRKIFFVVYRALTFAYHWAWVIYGWVVAEPDHYYTASNWSWFFTGVYYLMSFITSLYGIITEKDPPKSENGESAAADSESKEQNETLKILHKITWLCHVVAMIFSTFVGIFYWTLLAPSQPIEKLRKPLGQHKHSVQVLLLLIDLFLVSIPTRWVQVVYGSLFAFLYSIMVLIVHFAEVESAVYPITNFKTVPGQAVGVLVASTFVAPLILHTVIFGLYHLRTLIYRNTVGKKRPETKAKFDTAHENVAFTP